jgi:hypothetical protein
MADNILKNKAYAFAVRTIKLSRYLVEKKRERKYGRFALRRLSGASKIIDRFDKDR